MDLDREGERPNTVELDRRISEQIHIGLAVSLRYSGPELLQSRC